MQPGCQGKKVAAGTQVDRLRTRGVTAPGFMKILINHTQPFSLAHGGYQTQIEMTKLGLERGGRDVEWLRWWDDQQRGDILHQFAPPELTTMRLARAKGIRLVMTSLFSDELDYSPVQLRAKRWRTKLLPRLPGLKGVASIMPWHGLHLADINVVSLAAEVHILRESYEVPAEKIAQVPYGMDDSYLQAKHGDRAGDFLISTGTITARKRSIELAELAHRAETPVLFVGKPYHQDDPYWKRFQRLIDGRYVRYQSHVGDQAAMIELYRSARGFVLVSKTENWCLSAHEAACCGLPCLLRPLRWSKERFGAEAHYFTDRFGADVEILRKFYQAAPTLPAPRVRQWSWWEVGDQLAAVYRRLLPG